MSIQDFARQPVESYGLEEASKDDRQCEARDRTMEYAEYTGVREAASERIPSAYIDYLEQLASRCSGPLARCSIGASNLSDSQVGWSRHFGCFGF